MVEAEKQDPQERCSKMSETKPVSFVTLLWEELHELAKLRRRREWKERDLFEPKTAAEKSAEAAAELAAPPQKQPSDDAVFRAAHEAGLVGLAFSGGGIRSATFNLGVLQGFAKYGLLPMFDYLSTVSGGGYIGGWLESWIYRGRTVEGDSEKAKRERRAAEQVARCAPTSPIDSSPIRRVQECLNPDRSGKIDHGESQAIRFLREYSNYLTPRMGFLGADTWTAVAIYLRNLILNQTILILFLSFVLLLPYLAVGLTNYLDGALKLSGWLLKHIEAAPAFLLLFFALCRVGKNLDQLAGKRRANKKDSKKKAGNSEAEPVEGMGQDYTGEFPASARQGHVLGYVAVPLFLAAWCVCAWILETGVWSWRWYVWLIGGALGFAIVWLPVALFGIRNKREKDDKTKAHGSGDRDGQYERWNAPATRFISIGCSVISGGLGGILLWVVADQVIRRWNCLEGGIWHVVSFGPPLVVVVFSLVMTLQLGLMGTLTPDPRREWWGRLGGWLFLISILWAGVFALAIYSPLAVMWSRTFVTWAGIAWVVNTAAGVLGGKSSKTGAPESPSWKDAALSVTAYLFILGLGAALATLLEIVLGKLNKAQSLAEFLKSSPVTEKIAAQIISLNWFSTTSSAGYAQGTIISATARSGATPPYVFAHWHVMCEVLTRKLPVFVVAIVLVCLFLARRVDLNDFSMNYFYRNRLVRCYLGASHKFRKPNPFSGFDPHDDLHMCLMQSKKDYGGPFPIVNTALNLVAGQNLAWQERKAESFVMTPLHCGFDTWLERLDLDIESKDIKREEELSKKKSKIEKYGYRPAECYLNPPTPTRQGGFRMGAAISISGAAASPNMGYHSSPALAFLMTCFNVRLGFWAGNPRHTTSWMTPGPRFGLFWLLAELFGQSDDEASYVYLSDGGHFENLGLYELVKRRCRYIVVCDADADGDYTFGDLGGAIRKCREDIGVEITLDTDPIKPATGSGAGNGTATSETGSKDNFSEAHWAIGKIHYGLVDPGATAGILVYLKTSLTGDEPADVQNYHREHADFPHQTTADQWFTESQFESYRRLGQHVVERLFQGTDIGKFQLQEGHRVKQSTYDIFDMLRKYQGDVD